MEAGKWERGFQRVRVTLDDVRQKFAALCDGTESREAVASYASHIMLAEDHPDLDVDPAFSEQIWEAIIYLVGVDLQTEPGHYLQTIDDFEDERLDLGLSDLPLHEFVAAPLRSAQEFEHLSRSHLPADRYRARHATATDDLWAQIIRDSPDLLRWLVRNETLPSVVLRTLATIGEMKLYVVLHPNTPDDVRRALESESANELARRRRERRRDRSLG